MPRAVLDTNVLVSALISPGGPSAALLLELRAGAFELVGSPILLAELAEVPGRPKFRPYLTAAEATAYMELIRHEATIHDDPPPGEDPLSADPDDEYLLDLACRGCGRVGVWRLAPARLAGRRAGHEPGRVPGEPGQSVRQANSRPQIEPSALESVANRRSCGWDTCG